MSAKGLENTKQESQEKAFINTVQILNKEIEDLKKNLEQEKRRSKHFCKEYHQLQETTENIGAINGWIEITNYFNEEGTQLNKLFNRGSEKLIQDGCYSLVTHIKETIEYLVDFYESEH